MRQYEYDTPSEIADFMETRPHYTCTFRASSKYPIELAPNPLPGWQTRRDRDNDVDLMTYIHHEMQAAAVARLNR